MGRARQPPRLRGFPNHVGKRQHAPAARWWRSGTAGPTICGPTFVLSRRVDDLAVAVGTARRAGDVRELRVTAARATGQQRARCLPLRTADTRVAPRHLPLRDGHFNPPGSWPAFAGVRVLLDDLPARGAGEVPVRRARSYRASPANPPGARRWHAQLPPDSSRS